LLLVMLRRWLNTCPLMSKVESGKTRVNNSESDQDDRG